MSNQPLPDIVESLGGSAASAAAYLDACDEGLPGAGFDPRYYQACGKLLMTAFSLVDASHAFPGLLEKSPAAREVAESIAIGNRLAHDGRAYSPQLEALLSRCQD